jgi:hypothetical protein
MCTYTKETQEDVKSCLKHLYTTITHILTHEHTTVLCLHSVHTWILCTRSFQHKPSTHVLACITHKSRAYRNVADVSQHTHINIHMHTDIAVHV